MAAGQKQCADIEGPLGAEVDAFIEQRGPHLGRGHVDEPVAVHGGGARSASVVADLQHDNCSRPFVGHREIVFQRGFADSCLPGFEP